MCLKSGINKENILSELNQAQKEAVQLINGPVLIVAGAGSGKTRALTHRVAYLIHKGVPKSSILCLTFTNKAAGEMRRRIQALLNEHKKNGFIHEQ